MLPIVIRLIIIFLPLLIFMILGIINGFRATRKKQKEIDFDVELLCEECGERFKVPVYEYSKNLYTKQVASTKGMDVGAFGFSSTSVVKELRKVFCPVCQRETWCKWLNIGDFPKNNRIYITIAFVKGVLIFWGIGFIYLIIMSIILSILT